MAARDTLHNIYVISAAPRTPGTKPKPALTQAVRQSLSVLEYIYDLLERGDLTAMGVRVRVHVNDLRDTKVAARLQRLGITQLPALVTGARTYTGLTIMDVYAENLQKLAAWRQKQDGSQDGGGRPRRRKPLSGEDALAAMYEEEMGYSTETMADGPAPAEPGNADESSLGEGSDMMESYRSMMARRDPKKPAGVPERRAAAPPAPERPNNVGHNPVLKSFSNEDGQNGDFEEENTPEDFRMESAYWENQQESM